MKVLIELNKKLKARNHFLERENNVRTVYKFYCCIRSTIACTILKSNNDHAFKNASSDKNDRLQSKLILLIFRLSSWIKVHIAPDLSITQSLVL